MQRFPAEDRWVGSVKLLTATKLGKIWKRIACTSRMSLAKVQVPTGTRSLKSHIVVLRTVSDI